MLLANSELFESKCAEKYLLSYALLYPITRAGRWFAPKIINVIYFHSIKSTVYYNNTYSGIRYRYNITYHVHRLWLMNVALPFFFIVIHYFTKRMRQNNNTHADRTTHIYIIYICKKAQKTLFTHKKRRTAHTFYLGKAHAIKLWRYFWAKTSHRFILFRFFYLFFNHKLCYSF